MNAVLRVSWTFFTAIRLQRWLGAIGLVLGSLCALGGFVVEPLLWMAGLLALFIFAAFPTLFASPAIFRALSSPRANRLLPHFRTRMLGAVALFLAALLATVVLLLFGPLVFGVSPPTGRAVPVFGALVTAFTFATAMFLIMFLYFGDWRWIWLWFGAAIGIIVLGRSPSTRELSVSDALGMIPIWVWFGATLVAWIAFAAWYLRARRIRPVALVPQPLAGAWSRAKLDEPVTRESVLRVLVTAKPPGRHMLDLGTRNIAAQLIGLGAFVFFVPSALRFLHFTTFVWPFVFMIGLWASATSVVHRSRLLWLRMPGPRETVRREIEGALLRIFGRFALALLGLAALYASPLVALAPVEVLVGFALAASAGLFGTYAAFSAVPGGKLHVTGFALVMALQLGLLARPAPSLMSAVIVTAVELVCALLFRALALRRWREIDWSRVRPLPATNIWRGI